jgi:hypothetical protein
MGVFLGYTGTAKNVYYYDLETKRIKTSTHGIFDEANITVPQAERSVASQALIDLGYKQDDEVMMEHQNISQAQPIARIQLRSPTAKMPTQGSVLAAGYDVYSTVACDIKPQAIQKVPLGITIIPPQGTYIQSWPSQQRDYSLCRCHRPRLSRGYNSSTVQQQQCNPLHQTRRPNCPTHIPQHRDTCPSAGRDAEHYRTHRSRSWQHRSSATRTHCHYTPDHRRNPPTS